MERQRIPMGDSAHEEDPQRGGRHLHRRNRLYLHSVIFSLLPLLFFPRSVSAQCPPHYSLNTDPETSAIAACLASCPNEAYTDDQYTAIYVITTVGGGSTVIIAALVL